LPRIDDSNDGDHGTWVAGIAAAVGGNGRGITGVAPDATIMPIRVCVRECYGEPVAKGIRFAARRHVDVINLSIYVPLTDPSIQDVLDAVEFARARGSLVIGAAGNSREPWCAEPASSAMCVGAVDRQEQKATYSNGDIAMRDTFLVAPGGGDSSCSDMILSTSSVKRRACPVGRSYSYGIGTSGAAPFVSGVAALLAARGAKPARIERCLVESADDIGLPGRDPVFGYGRVNALKAIRCVTRGS
jgi:subtilisin family serine protease